MCLLVSNQGVTLMLSAKELKNHVIYTCTSRKHLYKWEGALPTHWGLLAQEMLRV